MKFLHVLIVFIIGSVISLVGALFKIQSWEYASELLTIGLLTEALAGIMLIVKLLTLPELKRWMQR